MQRTLVPGRPCLSIYHFPIPVDSINVKNQGDNLGVNLSVMRQVMSTQAMGLDVTESMHTDVLPCRMQGSSLTDAHRSCSDAHNVHK